MTIELTLTEPETTETASGVPLAHRNSMPNEDTQSLTPLDPLLDVEEAAAYLRMTPGALYTARWRGTGPRGVKAGRKILFRVSDLGRYLDEHSEVA